MDPSTSVSLINSQVSLLLYSEGYSCLAAELDNAIETLSQYIFRGHCTDTTQWRSLFKALSQALFMYEYLTNGQHDLCRIAEAFLEQFRQWQLDLLQMLN